MQASDGIIDLVCPIAVFWQVHPEIIFREFSSKCALWHREGSLDRRAGRTQYVS
jgi:hypothetical protein